MSDESRQDDDLRKAIRQASRRLTQKSEAERRVLLQEALDQALAEELAEKRAEVEREAAVVREELIHEPHEEARRARRTAPSTILLLLMLLLILLLIATITGRLNIQFPGSRLPANVEPTLQPRINGSGETGAQVASLGARETNPGDMPAIGSMNVPAPEVGADFRDYYAQHGGERVFGRPISDPLTVNGRAIQWFERARLEAWPEHASTPYAIQSGRVGAEFTKGISFPRQSYFVSRPGLRYFAETGHGVRDPFLQFWDQNGGLDILGYPISDEVQELLPDGQIHTVQYFERGRIEYHPQHDGTPFAVQLGLLGRALYLNESKPSIIPPALPTPVPLP